MNLFKPNIEKLEKNKNINGLIKAIQYNKSLDVPKESVKALGRLKDSRSIEPLINLLLSSDTKVSCYAASALGEIGDPIAIDALCETLNTIYSELYHESRSAIKKIWKDTDVDQLINNLNGPNPYYRRASASLLKDYNDPRVVDSLLVALNNKDKWVRVHAADSLIQFVLYYPIVTEHLKNALNDSDPIVRKAIRLGIQIGCKNHKWVKYNSSNLSEDVVKEAYDKIYADRCGGIRGRTYLICEKCGALTGTGGHYIG